MRNPNVLNIAVRVKVEKAPTLAAYPYICTASAKFTPFGRFTVTSLGATQASARKFAQGRLLHDIARALTAQGERQNQP